MLLLQREFRELTPAHHLRGAEQNRDLSAKVGRFSALSKPTAAPRLVHALVSLLRQGEAASGVALATWTAIAWRVRR